MSLGHNIGSGMRVAGRFFYWLFKGKSLVSNVAFLIFAYFALKFVLMPAFLWVAGLNDVVAVLSGSMHHQPGSIDNTFTGWLVFKGFNETVYNAWPFMHGLEIGDVVTVEPGNISAGDVIVYYYGKNMIIHRVVNITEMNGTKYYTTKGDANPESMTFEVNIPESIIVGKAGTRVPFLGWPRVILYYLTGF